MSLTECYRPRTLADILGQSEVVDSLRTFLQSPYSTAFLFSGASGVGKSATAVALATELGVAVEQGEFGGLWQIASGEQTGESVRAAMENLRVRPWYGSGWRCLITNECDVLTPNAAMIWLDALENIPPHTVIIFTTNNTKKIPGRLRDRCERFEFTGGSLFLRSALQELVDKVWKAECAHGPSPNVEDLGELTDDEGNASFRRVLQRLAPILRDNLANPPAVRPELQAALTHRANGDRNGKLHGRQVAVDPQAAKEDEADPPELEPEVIDPEEPEDTDDTGMVWLIGGAMLAAFVALILWGMLTGRNEELTLPSGGRYKPEDLLR